MPEDNIISIPVRYRGGIYLAGDERHDDHGREGEGPYYLSGDAPFPCMAGAGEDNEGPAGVHLSIFRKTPAHCLVPNHLCFTEIPEAASAASRVAGISFPNIIAIGIVDVAGDAWW